MRVKGKPYHVIAMEDQWQAKLSQREDEDAPKIQVTADSESNLSFRCRGEDGEEKKFQMKAKGLMFAYQAVIDLEQKTGSKQLLVIDVDKGEWWTYSLNEMKEKNPALAKFLKRMEQKRYIT